MDEMGKDSDEESYDGTSSDNSSVSPGDSHASVFTLEFGIAIHSVLIGLSIGTATDEFIPLLIAISFHQFFEGLAISSIVLGAKLNFKVSFLLLMFYVSATPFGIVLTILLRNFVNTNSRAILLAQGIFDSLSAGILVYNGLVNILAPHFSSRLYKNSSLVSMVGEKVHGPS